MYKTLIFFLCVGLGVSYAQSYSGTTTKTVNFREAPNAVSAKLASLPQGTPLFVFSEEPQNQYYHVLHLATLQEGYVYATFVELGEVLSKNKEGLFTRVGRTMSSETVIRTFNSTDKTLILRLDKEEYTFAPQEKRVLKLTPGTYAFQLLVPNVLPEFGTQTIENGYEYLWNYSEE